MSAALPPSSPLRVPTASSAHEGGAPRRRGHLRLVTAPPVREPRDGSRPAPLPELTRRPLPPRASSRPAAPRLSGLAALAPHHPAVRAALLREREQSARARTPADTGLERPGAAARLAPAPAPPFEGASQSAASTRARAATRSAGVRRGPAVRLPLFLRALVALTAPTFVLVLAVATGIVASGLGPAPAAATAVTVRQGQSLWEIASATGSADVAGTVTGIVELNDLSSSTVHPGQVLLVPVR